MKVLVGMVTFDGHRKCRDQILRTLANLTSDVEYCLVTNSGEADAADLRERTKAFDREVSILVNHAKTDYYLDEIVAGRNMIRDRFLAGNTPISS